jgi:hypothetical protein
MNAMILSVLFAAVAATGAESSDNPVLTDLVQNGVAMPNGAGENKIIKLPAPTMSDDMTAEAQTEALSKLAEDNNSTLEQFLQKNSAAPIALKIRTLRGANAAFRTIDVGFVAHGTWETLTSKKFGDGIVNTKKKENEEKGKTLSKSGFLTPEEMKARNLDTKPQDGREDRFFYTTFTLFDMVEVSATRYAVLTKTPTSILLATRVDPRFITDAEYPNQWRSVGRDATAKPIYGKPQPYTGAGFYVKVTKLKKPADVIFIEYHSAFQEPKGWFDGENTLRSKLPTIIQHEVKQFRGKLGKASLEGTSDKDGA